MKEITRIILILFVPIALCGLFFSCAESEHGSDNIVLIFSDAGLQNEDSNQVFFTPNHAIYNSDDLIMNKRVLNNFGRNDTLVISTEQHLLPFRIFHYYEMYDFYFRPGDTAVFTFNGPSPYLNKINRETKLYDFHLSAAFKRHDRLLVAQEKESLTETTMKQSRAELFDRMYKRHLSRMHMLDSLLEAEQVSADIHAYFEANLLSLLYRNGDYYKPDVTLPYQEEELRTFVNRQDLLGHPFYHHFMMYFYLWGSHLNIPQTRISQGISLDFQVAYDTILHHFENAQVREWMLFYILELVLEEKGFDEFERYAARFREDVTSTHYIPHMERMSEAILPVIPGETILTNILKSTQVEYTDLISQSRGQLVYVDLWASWCMPCRAVMPASKELQKRYRDRPVRFLYLSLDDKFSNWEKAVQEEGLFNYLDSYLLIQPKEAVLLKNLQVKMIPRYLLYDKSGQLIDQNAPGPDRPELAALLERYLN